ncbi:site-specific DNA-methyltransferase [Halomonas sp. MCCC 1A11062]|uniref:site-specific DNA-methyltransferase n=1 Tax=Halomonas sp. MCCC 1A11062 TaxID=2733485 RepID=UPI001F490379|nr:site-specific DNA-methyltransferase [Halomonas sp. MCCC 1A11062]MCE8039760.1 site-specific DNA-methyltransferase [Halomonas sp. MCCC 1A11062]
MKIIDAESPLAQSANLVAGNIEQLKALFPELITEGPNGVAVNVDVLKTLVGERAITDADEKYGLNWHGKRRARQLALTPSTGTLRPCPVESVDWDSTQNLMIEGDNLEVLKLLQKSYAGKVKLIYIDPPYNTGSDFVYSDNFQDNVKNYLAFTGQLEGGQPVSSNTEASGRFHTNWLNMIYPRVKLAWDLLRADGFLLVSIDDKEFGHLRTVLNELCGEENFIATLVFDRNRKNDAKLVSSGHEYMVLYARNKQLLTELDMRLRAPKEGVDEVRELFAELRKKHNDNWVAVLAGLKEHYATFVEDDPRLPLARFTKVDKRGPYRDDGDPSWPGGGGPRYDVPHPKTGKACTVPSRGWVWPTYERMKQEIDAGNIVFGEDEKKIPSIRRNLFEKDDQVLRSVIFSYAQKASQDFAALFDGQMVFQNPKSYRDLHRLISYLTEPGDLILDFFAGSGTTGHGTMLTSAEAEPSRRFVLVQLPEPLDPTNKEQKIAAEFCDRLGKPRTIAELTKERLRRASAKIKADSPMFAGDTGFRVFKLDTSNIRAWNPQPEDLEASLLDHQEHILPGRSEDDLLYELLLKLGLDLCVPIEQRKIAGKTVHSVGAGVLMACLAENITVDDVETLAQGIVTWHEALAPAGDTTCVFRDSAFANDVAKTNMAAILEQHGIQNVRSL